MVDSNSEEQNRMQPLDRGLLHEKVKQGIKDAPTARGGDDKKAIQLFEKDIKRAEETN